MVQMALGNLPQNYILQQTAENIFCLYVLSFCYTGVNYMGFYFVTIGCQRYIEL